MSNYWEIEAVVQKRAKEAAQKEIQILKDVLKVKEDYIIYLKPKTHEKQKTI